MSRQARVDTLEGLEIFNPDAETVRELRASVKTYEKVVSMTSKKLEKAKTDVAAATRLFLKTNSESSLKDLAKARNALDYHKKRLSEQKNTLSRFKKELNDRLVPGYKKPHTWIITTFIFLSATGLTFGLLYYFDPCVFGMGKYFGWEGCVRDPVTEPLPLPPSPSPSPAPFPPPLDSTTPSPSAPYTPGTVPPKLFEENEPWPWVYGLIAIIASLGLYDVYRVYKDKNKSKKNVDRFVKIPVCTTSKICYFGS